MCLDLSGAWSQQYRLPFNTLMNTQLTDNCIVSAVYEGVAYFVRPEGGLSVGGGKEGVSSPWDRNTFMNLTRHKEAARWAFYRRRAAKDYLPTVLHWYIVQKDSDWKGLLQKQKKSLWRWHFALNPTFHTATWRCTMKMIHRTKATTPTTHTVSRTARVATTATSSTRAFHRLTWRNCCGMSTMREKERREAITPFRWGWS